MKKKYLLLLAVVAAMLVCTACFGGSDTEQPETQPTPESVQEVEDTPDERTDQQPEAEEPEPEPEEEEVEEGPEVTADTVTYDDISFAIENGLALADQTGKSFTLKGGDFNHVGGATMRPGSVLNLDTLLQTTQCQEYFWAGFAYETSLEEEALDRAIADFADTARLNVTGSKATIFADTSISLSADDSSNLMYAVASTHWVYSDDTLFLGFSLAYDDGNPPLEFTGTGSFFYLSEK